MDDIAEGFATLEQALNAELVERSEEIRCALQALVSGTTLFLLGEPGIAKSLLARRMRVYIEGGEFFDHDMDKFSTPEDLFGPRSLVAMRDDRWERKLQGTIATADWAMLDEFFEAPTTLLKALLRALNERTYHQGTEIIPIPLTTVLCASNEIPTDPRLVPLFDRLLVRRQLSRIQDPGGFVRMLEMDRDVKPEPILSWGEVMLAQAQAARVEVPGPVRVAMMEIRQALGAVDIHPSDRRLYEAQKVVRAAAWMDGCTVADAEHLRCLSDICWSTPEQISTVVHVVDEVIEPLVSAADRLLRDVNNLRRQINRDLPEMRRMQLASELHDKLKMAERDLDQLAADATAGSRQGRRVAQVRRAIGETSLQIRTDLFQIPPPEVAT